MFEPERLKELIESGNRLVVYLHDNPDPDVIASAWALERIGASLGVDTKMIYGGRLGRAENRAMVRLLKIPLEEVAALRPRKGDRYALVDTQPGTGNNSFPHEQLRSHIIIDHHPPLPDLDADYVDIRPDEGTTTTMLLGYLEALGVEVDSDLATAAAYAIVSETQDLGREATKQDHQALHHVYPLARLPTLGEIRHPRHPREYYRTIARAMGRVQVSKNLCVCHIGAVHQPEDVAEIADLLVAMEQIAWCLTTGFDGEAMVLSMRTTHTDGHAENIMRKVLGRKGRGGGHGMIAGGRADCADLTAYQILADDLTARFIERLERRAPQNLRPLLDEP